MAEVLTEKQTPNQIQELTEQQVDLFEARFNSDVTEYWQLMAPHFTGGLRPDDDKPTYESVYAKEASFYTKVHYATREIAQRRRDSNVVVLPDADFSTVEKLDDEFVMRPAFPIVLDVLAMELGKDALGERRLSVGALTTRGMAEYRDGAPLPSYMGKYADLVDREYLLGSREAQQDNPDFERFWRLKGSVEEMLPFVDKIVDERIIKATRSGELDIYSWFDTKLIMLQQLVEGDANRDTSFVFIEDFIAARVIDHPQINGVHVFREQQNLTANQIIPSHVQIEDILKREPVTA